ncbi:nucleotidyltransferase [Planomicrobium sp. CPCC 101079]|uniref:SMODS domain-containing nucleotidyltransferase n=1 Tax=Planomicrobium sp. CPCC 101079 TaxID=2599618 RepID=UPI0011B4CBDD|nr:nucleotidyltransferase [Planomicrobium sp. CPCC 101079]TWT01857.1 nucleotidyltransferase [Planomicrobium sp. CPCC 101079]
MATIPTYFNDFLKEIRLTENQVNDLITGHATLRKRLNEYEDLSQIVISTFLQGSYRRATATRPKSGKRSDVDIIVVTNLERNSCTPEEALKLFEPFLEKHYKGKYRTQGRSLGIELSYVDLDLVITSAPSESQQEILTADSVLTEYALENLDDWKLAKSWVIPSQRTFLNREFAKAENEAEWKTEPLYIPDREKEEWTPTDPLAQMKFTWDKNRLTNKHFVNVVKALKWWRKFDDPEANHPKSYPLEHLIGQTCPDGIRSVAEGVTLTLENIITNYKDKPVMPDHGVPEHDVFGRLTEEEYGAFYERAVIAANIARNALNAETLDASAELWRGLFGNKFPLPPSPKGTNSIDRFSERTNQTSLGSNRFA